MCITHKLSSNWVNIHTIYVYVLVYMCMPHIAIYTCIYMYRIIQNLVKRQTFTNRLLCKADSFSCCLATTSKLALINSS